MVEDGGRTSKRREFITTVSGATAIGIAGCLGGDGVGGSDYPSETIRLVVPWEPGGGSDTYAQQLAPRWGNELGVNMQVDHVPGSAGLTGIGEVYRSKPDGYTILIQTIPAEVIPALIEDPDFDMRELTGLGVFASTAITIVANPEHEFENYEDLVQRYQDGEFSNIGGLGKGGQQHIAANVIQDQHEFSWESYIPYDGTGPVTEAVVGGEVPAGLGSDVGFQSSVESGDVDVVGILFSDGSQVFPEVDPVTEFGYANIDFIGQFNRIMTAPPDLPDDIQSTLESSLENVMNSREIENWSNETGNPVFFEDGETAENVITNAYEGIPEAVDLEDVVNE